MVAILGANSVSGVYEVSNSVRFHNPSRDKLSITPSSASNRKTMTFSCWAKRSTTGGSAGAYNSLFSAKSSGNEAINIAFGNGAFSAGGDYLEVTHGSSAGGGNYDWSFRSNGFYRDFASWYHLVVAIDTTQSSANDRIKLYVNGVEIDKTVTNSIALNADTEFNNTQLHMVGAFARDDNSHFDGYLAETNFVDGSALSPTSFGKFNDNGVWIPIKYTGGYGTNGFYLEFKQTGTSQNSSGIGADTSGNDNHFAVTNLASTDITEDTCTNNFATLNPNDAVDLEGSDYNVTGLLSEGNLDFKGGGVGTGDDAIRGTIGISNGKWYWESKIVDNAKAGYIGISATEDLIRHGGALQGDTAKTSVIWDVKNGDITKNGSSVATGYGVSTGDIVGLAFDLDGGDLYIYQNGTALNSGSAVVTGISDNLYLPFVGCENGSTINRQQLNFGNPVHSISSGNNDGKYGNFEYAPPSGYYAICTKRLAEFG